MRNLILNLTLVIAFVFVGCSSDDDNGNDNESTCVTCEVEFLVTITSEYCDNGDGTVDVTTDGQTETVDLEGVPFSTYIEQIGLLGTCN
ncbi:MAG: hypothetical protein AAGF77_02610 [Bacteroidota bacterium]